MKTLELSPDPTREMGLLDYIERDPDVTQANLAERLGIAVGTVNWHLKRLVAKGYVKVKRLERRKLKYLITPEGMALRARLTVDYIEQSMVLYRNTRGRVRALVAEVKRLGYSQVWLDAGEALEDIADVCRLTCLEQGLAVVGGGNDEAGNWQADRYGSPGPAGLPALVLSGLSVSLRLPAGPQSTAGVPAGAPDGAGD